MCGELVTMGGRNAYYNKLMTNFKGGGDIMYISCGLLCSGLVTGTLIVSFSWYPKY